VTAVRLAAGPEDVAAAYAVRTDVFVTEQGVPPDLELDELDETADHFIAYDGERAVGAGRLVVEAAGFADADPRLGPVAHLGRLAVRPETRGTGLGIDLVRAIESRAAGRGLLVVALSAQTHALGFYERLGYTAYGPEFDDAGLPHRWMSKLLLGAPAHAGRQTGPDGQ
jgi:predicted GNAT family N-acyltransferase